MLSHKVCIIECPVCHTEKPITRMHERCVVSFTCKVCRHQCRAVKHQQCFVFEGISPINGA